MTNLPGSGTHSKFAANENNGLQFKLTHYLYPWQFGGAIFVPEKNGRPEVSGHSEPWLRGCVQCDGGSWWCAPRSERIGASANSDFHIRGVSSMARLAG